MRALRLAADLVSAVGLSTAALLLQSSYSNDLMDPYLIGTLSGAMAALSAAVAALGVRVLASFSSYLAAFLGATVPGLVTAAVALTRGKFASFVMGLSLTLALQGLASVLAYVAAAKSGLPLLPMLLGTTQYASEETLKWSSFVVALSWLYSIKIYSKVSLMEYPEGFPESFSVPENSVLTRVLLVSALSSSAVVACCGVLPFLGLMGGIVGRRLSPPGSRKALFLSNLSSFVIMSFADFVANSFETPYGFLPVGSLLSLIGGIAVALLVAKEI